MTIYLDGSYNAASGTRGAFAGLSDELVSLGHPEIPVTEGDREYETQLAYWNERMVPAGDENGRRVYRRVWWNGLWWSQIHPWAVAPPGSSNHESRRSNDLAWPYNDSSADAHKAAQRLAPNYGISWEGRNFDEDWHWTFWGELGTIGARIPASSSTPESEEDDMKDKYMWKRRADGVIVNAIFNTISGYFQPFESNDGAYNTAKAQGHDVAGPTFEVSESDWTSIERACAQVRGS